MRDTSVASSFRVNRAVVVVQKIGEDIKVSPLAGDMATATEEDTACCYAVQDKVWVTAGTA
jgi:hypothetical protein